MKQDISLWSPVIVASLAAPHKYQKEHRYPVGPLYKRIEDIKLKIRNPCTEQRGRLLETRMKLEVIILAEDQEGKMILLSHPEIIKLRLSMGELCPAPAEEKETGYITRVQDLSWDGMLEDSEIIINYSLSYMIMAIREQVVKLYTEDDRDNSRAEQEDYDRQTAREDTAAANDSNDKLKKKIFLYERDMLSLQHAIKKAEERNAVLNRELNGTRQLLQKLQDAITRKDLLISHYENYPGLKEQKPKPLPAITNTVGQRLKRMFVSSL